MQGAIVDALMGGLVAGAEESLEALLGLVAALARDLQDDFLTFFPRLMQRLAQLVTSGQRNTHPPLPPPPPPLTLLPFPFPFPPLLSSSQHRATFI